MIMQSEQIDQIAGAMSKLQKKALIFGDNSRGHNYKYVSLDKVVLRLFPEMTALGLSVTQPLGAIGDEPALITLIMHDSGQWIKSAYPLAKAGMRQVNDAQQLGAAITYARRYGLLSAFGIATSDDDDGACLTEKPAPKAKKKPAGKKYESKDPTPAESIITDINNCTDIEELTKLYKAHEQTIMDSPKKDEIVSNFSIQKGFLEERGRK